MNIIRATRKAIEQRMTIADFDSVLDMLTSGGSPTYTGKSVSPKNALGVAACWDCVNVLADDLATLPFMTYRWLTEGVSREEARDHYLWDLLYHEVNPRMTAFRFKKQMETWRNLWGNAYAEIDINGRGQVTALWPMRPDRVSVWALDPSNPRSEIWYTYTPLDSKAEPIYIPADRMLHLRGTSIDGIIGLSPIDVHRQSLALQMGMTEYAGRFYGNGASPKGLFSYKGKLNDKTIESVKAMLREYEGLSNSHKTMLLEEGMEYHDVGIAQNDAQFIESMNYNILEIARIYKVPPHRVAQLERSTFANIEQQSMEYVQYTLMPNAANWVSEMHCSLLSGRERQTIFVEPDFTHLLMADHAARAAYYTALADRGVLAPDDMREREGYNPLPGGVGKLPRVALNTLPIDSDQAKGISPNPTDPQKTQFPKNGNLKGSEILHVLHEQNSIPAAPTNGS